MKDQRRSSVDEEDADKPKNSGHIFVATNAMIRMTSANV